MRRLALIALVLALAGLVWFVLGGGPSVERGTSDDAPTVDAAPTVRDAALAATEADTRTDVAIEVNAVVPVDEVAFAATSEPSFRELSLVDASVRWVSESTVEFALCTRDPTTREQITLARVPLPRWSGSAAEPVRVVFVR